ncbi:MAG: class I SAM-dependent methyltransferase [Candidatus Pacebacteria bacterium]|nr:class I SAM-dependent methyltransferase [Candidatus Paceibacterota bacterium]
MTRKLPFPDNYFNGIVASKVINYIPSFEQKLGEEALADIFQEILEY